MFYVIYIFNIQLVVVAQRVLISHAHAFIYHMIILFFCWRPRILNGIFFYYWEILNWDFFLLGQLLKQHITVLCIIDVVQKQWLLLLDTRVIVGVSRNSSDPTSICFEIPVSYFKVMLYRWNQISTWQRILEITSFFYTDYNHDCLVQSLPLARGTSIHLHTFP